MTIPTWLSTAWTMAKQAPSLVTLLLLGGAYLATIWVYEESAKADELDALKAQVTTMNQDVGNLKTDVKNGRIEALEGQLFEARVSQCRAESDELKEVYGERVTDLQSQYVRLVGSAFVLPLCQDL